MSLDLKDVIRDVCQEVVPEEMFLFDEMWDALAPHFGRLHDDLRSGHLPISSLARAAKRALGGADTLDGGEYQLPRLIAALVASALHFGGLSIEERTEPQLRQLLTEYGRGCNLTTSQRDSLVTCIEPLLQHDFAGRPPLANQASIVDAALSSSVRKKHVYIERVVDGRRRKTGWRLRRGINSIRENPRYDIVVDECEREILFRAERESTSEPCRKRIDELTTMQAGMLWLALSKFGDAVEFQEIRDLFSVADDRDMEVVFRARHSLRTLFESEDLRNRLIAKRDGNTYPVPGGGVNFCWIRRGARREESSLRYCVGQPSEPT